MWYSIPYQRPIKHACAGVRLECEERIMTSTSMLPGEIEAEMRLLFVEVQCEFIQELSKCRLKTAKRRYDAYARLYPSASDKFMELFDYETALIHKELTGFRSQQVREETQALRKESAYDLVSLLLECIDPVSGRRRLAYARAKSQEVSRMYDGQHSAFDADLVLFEQEMDEIVAHIGVDVKEAYEWKERLLKKMNSALWRMIQPV